MPLVSRTRATLRSAELGFLGVLVKTRTHTPRFCGEACSAGLFVRPRCSSRPRLTSCWIVGKGKSSDKLRQTGRLPVRGRSRRAGNYQLGRKNPRILSDDSSAVKGLEGPFVAPRGKKLLLRGRRQRGRDFLRNLGLFLDHRRLVRRDRD